MVTFLRGPESVRGKDCRESYASVIEKMVNRMHQSEAKYGSLDKRLFLVDLLGSAMVRVRKYEEDGNTEWLMDAANWLILEAMYPAHERAHFRATGSEESPGYLDHAGTVRHEKMEGEEYGARVD